MGLVPIDLSSGPKEETDDHAGYVFPIRDSKDESPYRRPIHQTGHRLTTDPNDKSRHWTRQPSLELILLLDQGVRTWGDVRLVLASAALALSRQAERRQIAVKLAATSNG